MLNRILERIRDFLSKEPAIEFLDLIDEDSLPSTSDTLLLMSQYAGAIENYYKNHYEGMSDNKIYPNFPNNNVDRYIRNLNKFLFHRATEMEKYAQNKSNTTPY